MGAERFDNFIGGSYSSLTKNLAADTCVNLYYESAETGTGKNRAALLGAPGLQAFTTLPTSPVRGVLVGEDLFFVVAGDIYYQVFIDGTFQARGNVGDDSGHSPVLMFENGTQVMIISAGKVYIDGGGPGGGSVPVDWADKTGTCNTAGTAVTWVSGDVFPADCAGSEIVINGVTYGILSWTDSHHITLTGTAGTQTGVVFSGPGGSVPANFQNGSGTVDTSGTAVTWVSGDTFDASNVGNTFTIAGVNYTVAFVTDATHLVLTSSAGSQSGAAYSSTYGVTASSGAYIDGYYIVSKPGTRQFNISAINDGKSWNPLDFGVKEAYPDGIQTVLTDHEQLWLFGDKTTEVWQDTGAAAFPFQRIPNAFIQMGICAPATATRVAGTVAWLGGDARGRAVAYAANGFTPVRISTHAVETAWAAGGAVGDAVAFAYNDQGHDFWVISFPSANTTWVYDFTEKVWHQRGWWDGTQLNRVRGAWHGFVFDRHIVGDWESGKLYYLDTSIYDDDGAPIYHERAAPHVSGPVLSLANPSGFSTNSPFQNNQTFYSRFLLDMESGAGSGGVLSDTYTASWVDATVVTITHNLGTTDVCIEVFDAARTVFEPETVKVLDANTAVLSFGAPFTGSVVVIKGKPGATVYSDSFTNQTSITLLHGLGTKQIVIQCYDSTGLQVIPEVLQVPDNNHVFLEFAENFSGTVVVIVGAYMASFFGRTSIILTHNLGTAAVIVQCFDNSGLQVEPETLQVTSINTVAATFGASFNGYIVVFASVEAAAPFLILDWSDDGGHTFGIPHSASAGAPGQYTTRVIWRRLGKARDRVFRVRYLAKGKVAFINAYLESGAGSM